ILNTFEFRWNRTNAHTLTRNLRVNQMRYILLAIALFMGGCGGGVTYEYNPKTREVSKAWTSSGSDPQHWLIDVMLRNEAGGKAPPKKFKSWREYWKSEIASWRETNQGKYEKYLIKERRAHGLPEI